MKNIDTIIFDLDGTLIDSMGIWEDVDIEFLNKRGISVPNDLFEDLEGGNSLKEIAYYFKEKFSLEESIEEILDEWTSMVKFHYANDVELKPGILNFLDFLKENNFKIGIGTSNSRELAELVLKNNNIYGYFDEIVSGSDEVKGKPFPDIFIKVANKLKSNSENCLVFEDVFEGVLAAKSAHMKVWVIFDKYCKTESARMKELSDYYTVRTEDILKIFKKKRDN